jgi:hypothetical protein
MTTKKIHRRYPEVDWDYKAIETIINDNGLKREVIYYTLKTKGKLKQGVEMYSGYEFLPGSFLHKKSSRSYPYTKYPSKYKSIVEELKKVHSKTKWSTAKKVNEN